MLDVAGGREGRGRREWFERFPLLAERVNHRNEFLLSYPPTCTVRFLIKYYDELKVTVKTGWTGHVGF